MVLMTVCSWQNKFCDGNSVRSVRRFVLHVIRSMVILFWVPFFANICADFRWSPMMVTGDVILPPCCFRTESAWFPILQMLKTTGGRRGMTRNDKDEGCCYPTPQATNKGRP